MIIYFPFNSIHSEKWYSSCGIQKDYAISSNTWSILFMLFVLYYKWSDDSSSTLLNLYSVQ